MIIVSMLQLLWNLELDTCSGAKMGLEGLSVPKLLEVHSKNLNRILDIPRV